MLDSNQASSVACGGEFTYIQFEKDTLCLYKTHCIFIYLPTSCRCELLKIIEFMSVCCQASIAYFQEIQCLSNISAHNKQTQQHRSQNYLHMKQNNIPLKIFNYKIPQTNLTKLKITVL